MSDSKSFSNGEKSVITAGVQAQSNVISAKNDEVITKLKTLRSRIQTAVNYIEDAKRTAKPIAEEYFSLNKGDQANKNKDLLDKIPLSIEEIIKSGESLIMQVNTKINKLSSDLVNKK